MSPFPIHTTATAPEASKPVLQAAQEKFGRVPNLIGGLASAPIAAEAYLQLGQLVGRSSFSPTERHVIWFTLNAYHNCQYCMAAHTAMAKSERIAPEVVKQARDVASYDDPKLEALRAFTYEVAAQRGWVSHAETEAFLAAGYNQAQVLEILVFVAHKVISNYGNHLLETPIDDAFAPFAWENPADVAA